MKEAVDILLQRTNDALFLSKKSAPCSCNLYKASEAGAKLKNGIRNFFLTQLLLGVQRARRRTIFYWDEGSHRSNVFFS